MSAPDEGLPLQVDKETNTEEAEDAGLAVRPKERSGLSVRQRPLVRSSVIVRSQTFSPGERSQYICRVRTGPAQGGTWYMPGTCTCGGHLKLRPQTGTARSAFIKYS